MGTLYVYIYILCYFNFFINLDLRIDEVTHQSM